MSAVKTPIMATRTFELSSNPPLCVGAAVTTGMMIGTIAVGAGVGCEEYWLRGGSVPNEEDIWPGMT